ncbi:MAG: hypothetical protein IT280_00470 [Ignavibacteria bacterium]|nr:hypothetical protein [Ignavibacteria bacterium]
MHNSKLIKILQHFSDEEIKEFRKFIDSSFFNKEGSYIVRVFDEIKKYYPVFDSDALMKEKLYKKIYKDKTYNDAIMRKAGSALIKLCEEYIKFRAFKESETESSILYLRKLREMRIQKLFESESVLLEKQLNITNNSVDSEYFRNRFRLELEKINYYLDHSSLISLQQKSMQNIQRYIVYDCIVNLLDIGYNILVGITTMYKGEKNISLRLLESIELDSFGEILSVKDPELYPVFNLFYKRYLGFKNFDDDNFYYEYKKIALENLKLLTWDNQFAVFISLQNFCTRKFIEGKRFFKTELHEVHKEMLDRGLYVQKKDDYMNLHTFRNIVLTASNLQKNDWIIEFMNQYISKILPEQRESLQAWTKALVHYNTGKFSEALNELQSVKNDHFLTKHEIKALTMKMFYELNDFEPGISFAESYRKMVQNDKTYAELHRTSYTNFSLLYLKLIKLKADKKYRDADMLKLEIEKTVTNSKEWLLEKVNELIK